MGLKFDGSSLFPFLKNGITFAIFKLSGYCPSSMHLLNKSCKGAAKQSETFFNEKIVQVIAIKAKFVFTVVDSVHYVGFRYRF